MSHELQMFVSDWFKDTCTYTNEIFTKRVKKMNFEYFECARH